MVNPGSGFNRDRVNITSAKLPKPLFSVDIFPIVGDCLDVNDF